MELPFDPSDPLLQFALILFAGILGGELAFHIHLPRVTGWIFTGIILRGLNWDVVGPEVVSSFSPFMNFVLGYIAFTVGAALYFPGLRNAGRRLGLLILAEATVTPLVVILVLYFGSVAVGRPLGMTACLILGAIAIAGAPGTTVLVVQESRSRGILTRTLLAAVALVDMVAVGVFTFVSDFLSADGAQVVRGWAAARNVGVEFSLAGLSGLGAAGLVLLLTGRLIGPSFVGPGMVAVILGSWGVSVGLGVSGILACTFAGIAVSNLRHDTYRSSAEYLRGIGEVLFAAFFTMAGMKLDFSTIPQAFLLVVLFLVGRFVARYGASWLALLAARAPIGVRNNFGLATMPHGGVAVGLVLVFQEKVHFEEISDTVTTVALAALAINQLIGPGMTRMALRRSGESDQDRLRLLDFLREDRIAVGLKGDSQGEVIRQLATQLYSGVPRPSIPFEEFLEIVNERESQESTCLGEGLMIPHAILETSDEICGVLGISSEGLTFRTPDGRPVHAVLLLATPKNSRQRHLEILASFANALTRFGHLREQLYHADTAAHAYEILHAEDSEDFNYYLEDALEDANRETETAAT